MKLLLGVLIGAGLFIGTTAFAGELIQVRNFGLIGSEPFLVEKFVDPDNGNVCYLASAAYKGGISCLKP